MELVNCNLCGNSENKIIYSMPDIKYNLNEWFNIVECSNCGLGFVNPRPTMQEISEYYPEDFYDYFNNELKFHNKRYKKEAYYLEKFSKGKTLLDIGCANGDFPRYMKSKGWTVEGVEISNNSKRIDDFKVYYQDFTTISFNETRYDAITTWAVIEHTHDPISYFKKASSLLKKDGVFIFLVTNFESISSRHLFREDIPRHLYFFTKKNIEEYLDRVGLKLIRCDFNNQIYQMQPVNWLRFYLYSTIGKKYDYKDVPINLIKYLREHNLENSLIYNVVYYLATHPLTVIDRVLMPFYEYYQILLNKYGIVTYVAQKK